MINIVDLFNNKNITVSTLFCAPGSQLNTSIKMNNKMFEIICKPQLLATTNM